VLRAAAPGDDVSAQTRRPVSAALAAERLRRGPGLAALSVLYETRYRFVQFTTREIADHTEYAQSTIGNVLGTAQRLGLVERDLTTSAPRVPYWRLTVTGVEFVREVIG
jgi:DNA-binding MarR family transcriptional regulator